MGKDIEYDLSVCITIRNNEEYVNDHMPEKIEYIEEDEDDIYPIYPFEIDMSMKNFKTLFCGLGIDLDIDDEIMIGEENPDKIIDKVDKVWVELCLSPDYDYIDALGNHISCKGLNKAKVKNHLKEIKQLCEEAKRRKELVIWV